MSGVSMGYARSRPFNGKNKLRRCSNSTEADNVVLIDIESDGLNNVIIIDAPEYLHKNIHRPSVPSRAKRCPQKTVICIDDDETNEDHYTGCGGGDDDNVPNNPSSSGRFKDARKTPDENGDDCQVVQEKRVPVKLTKCKRTYSGRSRYGLNSDLESGSSDSDSELMVDSVGKLQEEWEKAFSKRKYDSQNTQSGVNGFENTSRAEHGQTEEHLGKASNRKEDLSPSAKEDKSAGASGLRNEDGQNPKEPSSSSYENFADDLDMDYLAYMKNQSASYGVKNFYHTKESSLGKGSSLREDPCSSKAQDCNGRKFATNCDYQFTNKSSHVSSSSKEKKNLFSGAVPKMNCESRHIHITRNMHSMDKFSPGPGQPSSGRTGAGISTEKCDYQENGEAVLEKPSKSYEHLKEAEENIVSSPSKSEQGDKSKDLLHSQGDEDGQNNSTSIISERERLKETDEYKKAQEEEMAARQRALQIQAEEAQQLRRLLKRRKAEQLRLLDMERRQKQRVDEMRETQKKDEENMNMKEEIRSQVRSELSKLEATCRDMASVLRGLGIFVGNSPNPQSNEVRVAYKKALLTFHPDRASRDDIRQLVEAEEKFKLISRMKDKYFPTL